MQLYRNFILYKTRENTIQIKKHENLHLIVITYRKVVIFMILFLVPILKMNSIILCYSFTGNIVLYLRLGVPCNLIGNSRMLSYRSYAFLSL